MKGAVAALLLLAGSAGAAEPIVDDATLQAAVDHELQGIPRDGELHIDVNEDGSATVTYIRSDGAALQRRVILPPRKDDAVEVLALLAGNMVRDQTRDVLADLTLTVPASPPVPRQFFSVGLFPPVSTDLAYGGPVVANVSLNLILGVSPGVRGASISAAIDIQTEDTVGVQIAPVTAVALRDADGAQISAAASLTFGHHDGAQISAGVNLAPSIHGVQIGALFNGAREMGGAQIGTLNAAGKARGLQLGVVNYADDIDGAQIGIINVVRKGITEVDVWAETHGTGHVLLRHGKPYFHTLWGGAVAAPSSAGVSMVGMGFGSRVFRGPVDLDLGVMTWYVGGSDINADLSLLNQARLTTALPLGDHLALFAGASFNVYVADSMETGEALKPGLDRMYTSGDTVTRLWPSAFAGLRVR